MAPAPHHVPKINREQWLTNAVGLMRDRLFTAHGFRIPEKVRISCGFPEGGGKKRIGECWKPASSADKVGEIFVHPKLADPVEVLAVVAHEVIHAVNHAAGQDGHGKVFRDIALKVGLEGRMTTTHAGPELVPVLKDYAAFLGPYPHGSLLQGMGPTKKQSTRLLKVLCPGCGYTIRVTQTWVDVGLPVCPCGADMIQEGEEEDAE